MSSTQTALDQRINALRPAGRLVLSQSNGYTVAAERSGDGRTIRIVRESANGFQVIREEAF